MTFQELLTEFYARGFDYLNDGGAGATRAKRWINQGYMDIIEADDWPFLNDSVSGVAPLTITDLGTVESCVNDTTKRSLSFVDRRTLVESYPDLTTAGSARYAYFSDATTLQVFPVSTSETITVRYWQIPTELSAAGDTPLIPARYQYAIIDYACGRAYMDSDNPEMAQAARADADSLVQAMRTRLLYPQHQDPDAILTYGYSTDSYGFRTDYF